MKCARYSTRALAKRLLPLLVAGALASSAALADATFSIQPDTLNPAQGDIGDAFDVLLTNDGTSDLDIAGFSFGLFTTDTDITFTEADVDTIVGNYIFLGNSFVVISLSSSVISLATPVGLPPLPGQTLTANDATNTPGSWVTVGAGDTVDLGRVLFDVNPNAVLQSFTISFLGSPGLFNPYNNLSDENGDPINVDSLQSANSTISQTVPEPSPAVLLPIGLTCLWMFRRLFRKVV